MVIVIKKKVGLPHKKYLIFGLLTILVLLVFFGWHLLTSAYQLDKAGQQNNTKSNLELKFSKFSLTVPANYILTESPDYTPDMYGRVATSSLSDESGCVRVANIQSVILKRNIAVDTGYSTWYPILEIQAWNIEDIKYYDVDTQNILQKRLTELANLSKLSPLDISKMSLNSFQANKVAPLFNPWEGYLACAGIYSLPSFIEKQELSPQSSWDEAYYGEVYEGNGDTFGVPIKVMIARKSNNWLLVKEQQAYPNGFKSSCPFGDLSVKEFNCANVEWSKLRNPSDYRPWVQQVLSWIH